MRSDNGWATAQMPIYVSSSQVQKATFVPPAMKAEQADALRDQVEAFIRAGGSYERIEQPTARPSQRNGRQA